MFKSTLFSGGYFNPNHISCVLLTYHQSCRQVSVKSCGGASVDLGAVKGSVV